MIDGMEERKHQLDFELQNGCMFLKSAVIVGKSVTTYFSMFERIIFMGHCKQILISQYNLNIEKMCQLLQTQQQ